MNSVLLNGFKSEIEKMAKLSIANMHPALLLGITGAASGGIGNYIGSKIIKESNKEALKSVGKGVLAGGAIGAGIGGLGRHIYRKKEMKKILRQVEEEGWPAGKKLFEFI